MTNKIYEEILNQLKQADSNKRICVVGIGSDLRGDDVAGLIIADELVRRRPSELKDKLSVIYASTAPENFTGEIKKIAPSHLIIVDCAELEAEVGEVRIINESDVGGVSFSTHSLPISIIIDYLKQDINFKTIIIGIQPADTSFGVEPSDKVLKACDLVCETIIKVCKNA
jgi:hydrogenase 3 maturation protease